MGYLGRRMSITEEGINGERLAYKCLANLNIICFGGDWIIKGPKTNKWYVVEVKHHAGFNPPPFYGNGTDISIIKRRLQFQEDTGIKTILLWINKDDNEIYWNFLEDLEKGSKFNTNNNIRIYPKDNYKLKESLLKL